MKKAFTLLLSLLCLLAVGCGSKETSPTPATPVEPGTVTEAAFTFSAQDTTVAMNAPAAETVAALGEPVSYFEAESCAFKGLDKTYTYSGFQLLTYPSSDGTDYLYSVVLTDDSVTTREGLYIGSASDAVIAAYGEPQDGSADNLYVYTQGDCRLSFLLQDGAVFSIEYLALETR